MYLGERTAIAKFQSGSELKMFGAGGGRGGVPGGQEEASVAGA